MPKPFILGLTGPTGAGKSTVSHFFEEAGVPVVDADRIARLVTEDASCLQELAKAFGADVLHPDGTLNRALVAQKAFSAPEKALLLNSITHPRVLQKADDEILRLSQRGARLIILDAPLLFESGADKICDKVLAVVSPFELRLARIMHRDGITREQALLRMSAQKEDSFYTEKADYVFYGEQSLADIQKAVLSLIHTIKGNTDETVT